MSKNIYILCPVRKASPDIRRFLEGYVTERESEGNKVHYPPRDVNQQDETGFKIMAAHKEAMKKSDEIHAYWSPESEGSVCDLGMALMSEKPLILINRQEVESWLLTHEGKSYTRVVYEIDKIYRNRFQQQ